MSSTINAIQDVEMRDPKEVTEQQLKINFVREVYKQQKYLLKLFEETEQTKFLIPTIQSILEEYWNHFVIPFGYTESTPDFVPKHSPCFSFLGHADDYHILLPSTEFDFKLSFDTMLRYLIYLDKYVKYDIDDDEDVLLVKPCYLCSFFNLNHEALYVFHFKSKLERVRYIEYADTYDDDDIVENIWKLRGFWHQDAKKDTYRFYTSWLPDHVLEDVIDLVRPDYWYEDNKPFDL